MSRMAGCTEGACARGNELPTRRKKTAISRRRAPRRRWRACFHAADNAGKYELNPGHGQSLGRVCESCLGEMAVVECIVVVSCFLLLSASMSNKTQYLRLNYCTKYFFFSFFCQFLWTLGTIKMSTNEFRAGWSCRLAITVWRMIVISFIAW